MSAQAIQTRRWTRQEYERLVAAGMFHPEERLELVEGEIVRMTSQGSAHATAVVLVQRLLEQAFGEGYFVRGQMPIAVDPSSEPEPDLAVIRGTPHDYATAHPSPQHVVLIVEVADATLDYDRRWKAPLYAQAGIPEYWIVNLVDRCLEVHRTPGPSQSQNLLYQSRQILRAAEAVSPLACPQASLSISDFLP